MEGDSSKVDVELIDTLADYLGSRNRSLCPPLTVPAAPATRCIGR
jgi:hypothetical protein